MRAAAVDEQRATDDEAGAIAPRRRRGGDGAEIDDDGAGAVDERERRGQRHVGAGG